MNKINGHKMNTIVCDDVTIYRGEHTSEWTLFTDIAEVTAPIEKLIELVYTLPNKAWVPLSGKELEQAIKDYNTCNTIQHELSKNKI